MKEIRLWLEDTVEEAPEAELDARLNIARPANSVVGISW